MSLQVNPLENVGVAVGGFDINQPIRGELREELMELWNEHAILLFRGQDITPERQIEFSRLFGPLEQHPLQETTSAEYPELFMLVNDPDKEKFHTAYYDGEPIAGRLDWHIDLYYTGKPNRGALLRSVVCAEKGGLTGFGDLAKAHDALDEATREILRRIEVTYAFTMQRRNMRFVNREGYEPGPNSPKRPSDIDYPPFPEVAYPAVVVHPVTGRRVLFICEQSLERVVAPHKAGLSNDEAVDLLHTLVEHTRNPAFHYFHRWQPGDMILWDNWRAMHCATGTSPGAGRVIHRTTIEGDAVLGRVVNE
jgi:taurine dioxygenase